MLSNGSRRAWQKALALLFPPNPEAKKGSDRSIYERFAIPFAFKPRLSFREAVVAAIATFLRVVLGCILFAIWGTYSLLAWFDIQNLFLRLGVLVPLFLVFLLSMALMLLAIAALVQVFLPAKS